MDPWIVNDTMDQCLICLLEIWAWLTKCYLKIDISTINPLIHKNPHSHSSFLGLFTSQVPKAESLPSLSPDVDVTSQSCQLIAHHLTAFTMVHITVNLNEGLGYRTS